MSDTKREAFWVRRWSSIKFLYFQLSRSYIEIRLELYNTKLNSKNAVSCYTTVHEHRGSKMLSLWRWFCNVSTSNLWQTSWILSIMLWRWSHVLFLVYLLFVQPQLFSLRHYFEWRSPVPHCGGNAGSESNHGDRNLVRVVRGRRFWILRRTIHRQDRDRQGIDRLWSPGRRIHWYVNCWYRVCNG